MLLRNHKGWGLTGPYQEVHGHPNCVCMTVLRVPDNMQLTEHNWWEPKCELMQGILFTLSRIEVDKVKWLSAAN